MRDELKDIEGYETWVQYMKDEIDSPDCRWNRVGIYGFPTKTNSSFSEIVIHYCYEFWVMCEGGRRRDDDVNSVKNKLFDKCTGCGQDIPDGIKMIALLEKL